MVSMLELKKRRLHEYLKAEEMILAGAQSYVLGNRSLTRGDLRTIRQTIEDLMIEIKVLEGKGRIKRVVLTD